MATQKKKILLRVLLALALLGGAAGFYVWKYMWNKPHQNVEEAKALSVAAPDLYAAFAKDSAAAGKLYTGKVVQVSGEVAKADLDQQQNVYVHLKAGEDGSIINCSLEEKAALPKAGDKLVLKGICGGYNPGDTDMGLPGDVVVNRCYLAKQ
jgi:hypothetical protein